MTEILTRRSLIGGLAAFIAAPAIIRVAGIMPIKAWEGMVYGESPAMTALEVTYRQEFMAGFIQRQILLHKWEAVSEWFPMTG